MGRFFGDVLSADAVQAFKPSPDVYGLAVEELGIGADNILFVSSNGFDVVEARSFGFRVCWINRRNGMMDPLGLRPNMEVSTLSKLTDRLCPKSG